MISAQSLKIWPQTGALGWFRTLQVKDLKSMKRWLKNQRPMEGSFLKHILISLINFDFFSPSVEWSVFILRFEIWFYRTRWLWRVRKQCPFSYTFFVWANPGYVFAYVQLYWQSPWLRRSYFFLFSRAAFLEASVPLWRRSPRAGERSHHIDGCGR